MTNLAYDDEAELEAYNPFVPQTFCRKAFSYLAHSLKLNVDTAGSDIHQPAAEQQREVSLIKKKKKKLQNALVYRESKVYLSQDFAIVQILYLHRWSPYVCVPSHFHEFMSISTFKWQIHCNSIKFFAVP